jgi:cardiolipin synthase (CMP-forming)
VRQPTFSWPNLITLLRGALVPVLLLLAEATQRAAEAGAPTATWRAAVLGVLVVIGATDLIDGYLARRFGWASELGALLDALADKLVQVGLVTYLALRMGPAFPPVPLWFLALLIARDGLLAVGWLLIRRAKGRVDVQHEAHGKLSSSVLFLAIALTLLGQGGPIPTALFIAAALLVIHSTAHYVRHGFVQARR